MHIGLIGLDSEGFNLALNFQRKQYDVIAYDTDPAVLKSIHGKGINTANSIKDLVETVPSKRIIWLMIPASQLIDKMVHSLQPYLSVGDILINGSPSFHKDSFKIFKEMEAFQIDYLDCSINSEKDNIRAMISGNRFAFNYCEQLFKDFYEGSYQYAGKIGS